MFPIPASISSLLGTLFLLLLGTPLVMWAIRLSPRAAGWRWDGWRTVAFGIGWGGLLGVLEVCWLRVLLHTGNYLPIPIVPSLHEWLLLALALPVVEECFFRGVMVGGLRRHWQIGWVVTLSALIYLFAHAADPWLAFVFLNGVVYTLAFLQSGSVAAPLLAHILLVTALLTARIHPFATADLPLPALGIALFAAVLIILLASSRPAVVPTQ